MAGQPEPPQPDHPLIEEEPRRTIGDSTMEAEEAPSPARQPSFRSWDETDHRAHASASSGSREQRNTHGNPHPSRETSSASGSDDLELLDEGEDSRDYDLRSKNGALYSRIDSQDDLGDDEYLEQVEASLAGDPAAETEDERRKRRKRRTRRVYGGGRRMYYADASSGARGGPGGRSSSSFGATQHSILETSWILFINHVSPGFMLLIPYAYSLTGIAFGIPLTALLLALGASFAQLLLTVEARYVGSGSYPSLASAVFPQVLNVQYLGEILVNLFVCFVGLARALIALVISSDLVIQLLTSAFPRARILHSYVFISLLMGLIYFVTSLLLVRFSSSTRPLCPASPFLSQLPSLSILLYPLALFILAISLKNLEDYPSLLKPDHGKVHWRFSKPHFDSAPLHTPTLWSGVSILFLSCCSSQGSTFDIYRGLRKRALPGSRNVKDPDAAPVIAPVSDSFVNRMIQRHRWESATSLAVIYTFLLYLFSGLIGYLNLLIITPNLMTALPINHAWFNVCRVLFLLAILPLLSETNIRPVRIAAIGLLDIPRKVYCHARSGNTENKTSTPRRKRPKGSAVSLDGNDTCTSSEDEDVRDDLVPAGASRLARAWQGRLALTIIWVLVIVFSCLGRGFRNIASVAEVVGCVGATWLSFILPSLFHIILFHVRRPRTIFVSDASAPDIQTDTLLLSKEHQLQKRLMGKRIWMDLVAFGLLLPFGIIGFGRGIWALASS